MLQECSTNGNINCDTLSCSAAFDGGIEVDTTLTVLSCNDPPAVNLIMDILVFTQMFPVNEIISESKEILVANGAATLDITLDQLQLDSAIGLQVYRMCIYTVMYVAIKI